MTEISQHSAGARAAGGPAARPPALAVPRRSWQALIVLLAGMFIALLDTTVVNVALPTIRTSLDASESTLSWIISGYALAFGLALIPAGRVGDRIGHKWVFFTGIALFTLASAACGLAQSDTQLVVFRVVQGLAGGIFVPAVTAFIQLLFPGPVRGKAFAIMGAVIGVSSALGPIIGGLIIQAFGDDLGWRLVFGVNLPIGAATLVAAALLLPTKHETDLVPLIEGQDKGWPLWTYLTLAAGVLLLVGFAFWEVAHTKRGHSPLVPPHLFSHAAFTGGVILALVYFAAFTSIFFTLSILWQTGLGHSALQAGVVSIPFAIGSILASSQSNQLSQRLGRKVLVIGTALVTVGLVWVWLVLRSADPAGLSSWDLLLPLFLAGLGNGAFIAPNAQFIIATVDRTEAGAASGVVSTVQRVGSAIGIAIIGSVLFGSLVITGPDTVASGFTDAAADAMLVSAIFSAAALVLVFALPKRTASGPPAGARRAAPAEGTA
jgi:MFS family permease